MPSPFPGMDPWLEETDHWPMVHGRLIFEMQSALNGVLRPKYLAGVEQRVFIADDPEARRLIGVADVRVGAGPGGAAPAPAAAVLEVPEVMRAVPRLRMRELRVEIVDTAGGGVVTVIELLSPTNKRGGSKGRASFLRERRQVLGSTANWVELDLLRDGQETFTRPPGRPSEYAAHISPVGMRPMAHVLPIHLTRPLPVVSIPLREPDPDALLDLQAVLTEAYTRGALDGFARYRQSPIPPLSPGQDAWADALLKEQGLR